MALNRIPTLCSNASACLIKDGSIVFAAEEERFRRVKHWAGFPSQAIESCLNEADIQLSDLDHIAINTSPKAHKYKKIASGIFKDIQLIYTK